MASRLQQKDLFCPGTKVSFYKNIETEFLEYFTSENDFVYCRNVKKLLLAMAVPKYESIDWRFFIDSSKQSLKYVLLHNLKDQKYGAVPIGNSTKLEEKYEIIKAILRMLKYSKHQEIICVHLKMVNFLLELRSGHTKHHCFLCYWNSLGKAIQGTVDE